MLFGFPFILFLKQMLNPFGWPTWRLSVTEAEGFSLWLRVERREGSQLLCDLFLLHADLVVAGLHNAILPLLP